MKLSKSLLNIKESQIIKKPTKVLNIFVWRIYKSCKESNKKWNSFKTQLKLEKDPEDPNNNIK